MKVLTDQTARWETGEILAPEDVNRVLLYAQDAVDDVASKRWARSVLTYPFVADAATPYTQAMSAEQRTWRFVCPYDAVIERGFLSANLTCTGAVTIEFLDDSTGLPPTGCTSPWLSTGGTVASADDDVNDINVDKFRIVAGQQYRIVISGTTFSTDRCDVMLHVAVDRWTSGTTPSYAPTLFTDASAPDATVVLANQTALTTAIAPFVVNGGAEEFAVLPLLVEAQNFTSVTDADLLKFTLPLWDGDRARASIVSITAWQLTAAASTQACTAAVRDASGTLLGSASAVTSSSTYATGTTSPSIALDPVTAGVSADTTADYSVSLVLSGVPATVLKGYALLWIAFR